MLDVTSISAGPGQASVLNDVSLRVGAKEGVALLGRNGVGKSTLLKTIMGLLPARSGQIHLDGQDITHLPPQHRAAMGLGYVPESRRIFAELSVGENIRVGRDAKPRSQRLAPDRLGPSWSDSQLQSLFPALKPLWDQRAGLLSGGEQQMVTIARSLAGAPKLLLLDEPSEGLAPLVVDALGKAMGALRHSGLALLMSEQNTAFAGLAADRVYVMQTGTIVMDGAYADIMAETEALGHYLAV